MDRWRRSVLVGLALGLSCRPRLAQPLEDGDCNLSSDAWLPGNASRGDCPAVLRASAVCRPACMDGLDLDGNVSCEANGSLVVAARCEPIPCNTTTALVNGSGDCPELLPWGAECAPECGEGYALAEPLRCEAGSLAREACARVVLDCPPGAEQRGVDCMPCPLATFKPISGPGPCEPCPDGVDAGPPGAALSVAACLCNSTTYTNLTRSGEVIGCIPCPENSAIQDVRVGYAVGDCTCLPTLIREPEDSEICRPPLPCQVGEYLGSNLTGPEPHKLNLGTCEEFVLGSNGTMPHGSTCKLTCREGTSPQFQSVFLKAVDTSVSCSDGVLTAPLASTWCSETSWEVPPLVFLFAVTLASIFGACKLHRRQILFEKECQRALHHEFPKVQPSRGASLMSVKWKTS